jgi:hypothetical protein
MPQVPPASPEMAPRPDAHDRRRAHAKIWLERHIGRDRHQYQPHDRLVPLSHRGAAFQMRESEGTVSTRNIVTTAILAS